MACTQYGADIAGTLRARHDGSPTDCSGQNIVATPPPSMQ